MTTPIFSLPVPQPGVTTKELLDTEANRIIVQLWSAILEGADQAAIDALVSQLGAIRDQAQSAADASALSREDSRTFAERSALYAATSDPRAPWYLRGDGRALDIVVDMQDESSYTLTGGGVSEIQSIGLLDGQVFAPVDINSPLQTFSGFRGLAFDGGVTYDHYKLATPYAGSIMADRRAYFMLATTAQNTLAGNQAPFAATQASGITSTPRLSVSYINGIDTVRWQYQDDTNLNNIQFGAAPRGDNKVFVAAAWNNGAGLMSQWLDGVCYEIDDSDPLLPTLPLTDGIGALYIGGLLNNSQAFDGAVMSLGFDNSGQVSRDAAYAKYVGEYLAKGGDAKPAAAIWSIGQSNALGEFGPNPDPVTFAAGEAHVRVRRATYGGRFERGAATHGDTSVATSSPAFYFADEWKKITGETPLFQELAYPGRSVTPGLTGKTDYWAPANSVGIAAGQTSVLDNQEQNFRRMKMLTAYSPEFAVMNNIALIIQGEADAVGFNDGEVTQEELIEYFGSWIGALSARYGIRTFAIVKTGRRGISAATVAVNAPGVTAVRAAWDAVIATRADCYDVFPDTNHTPDPFVLDDLLVDNDGAWISGAGYQSDGLHYTPAYFQAIGRTAARNLAAQMGIVDSRTADALSALNVLYEETIVSLNHRPITGKQYPSYAAFMADTGYTPADGTVVSAGGVQHIRNAAATVYPDKAGWEPFGEWSILHFGAVGDATVDIDESNVYAPTGTGAITGTDNYAAILAAVTAADTRRKTLHVPDGKFRVAIPSIDKALVFPVSNWLSIKGTGEIIADDNRFYNGAAGNGQLGNTLFATSSARDNNNFDNGQHEFFGIEGITIRGSWWREMEGTRDFTWVAGSPYRLHLVSGTNCKDVVFRNVTFKDAIGFCSTSSYGQSFTMEGCFLNRIAGDGIRAVDFSRTFISNNRVLHCDDDSMALTADDSIANETRPRRRTVIVSGNILECCEGPIALAASDYTFVNNKMFLTYGTGLSVFAHQGDVDQKGEGGLTSILIANNTVLNHMSANNRAVIPDGAWQPAQTSVNLGGNPAPQIGEEATTPALLPWDSTEVAWGPLNAQDLVGDDGVLRYRAYGATVANMIVHRTLPAVTNYSDWGYGRRFTRWGFDDPEVTDAQFSNRAIQVAKYWDGLHIVNPQIMGFINGSAILFPDTDLSYSLKNVKISGGQIINCRHGIDGARGGGTHRQDITVSNVHFDLDPHRVQPERNGNGWSDVSSTAPACVRMTRVWGVGMVGNVFKNAANPWSAEGGVNLPQGGDARVEGNIGVVDFGEAGSNTTDAGNLGLGRIHPASVAISYEVRNLDPASADYRLPRPGMNVYRATMPNVGHYVRGHTLHLEDGTIAQRLTTGSEHSLTTDWARIIP